jgi:hypothetical protein
MKLNFAAEWIELVFHVGEVPASNLLPETAVIIIEFFAVSLFRLGQMNDWKATRTSNYTMISAFHAPTNSLFTIYNILLLSATYVRRVAVPNIRPVSSWALLLCR